MPWCGRLEACPTFRRYFANVLCSLLFKTAFRTPTRPMPDGDSAKKIRGFVAIHPPQDLLNRLRQLQEQLQSALPPQALRWTPPDQMHLTLKFLGNVAVESVGEIQAALARSCERVPPLMLRAAGVGCFPDIGKPRVIWVGLEGDLARLETLQSELDLATRPWCEKSDQRAFHPHLTLGRVREASPRVLKQIATALSGTVLDTFGEWRAECLSLMQSILSPNGAEHRVLASFPLIGAVFANDQ